MQKNLKRFLAGTLGMAMVFTMTPVVHAEDAAPAAGDNVVAHTNAMEIYVSVTGDDSNPGTIDQPLQTISAARDKVRTMNDDMDRDIVVYLREGVYSQTETLNFTKEDSGTNGHTITYKAYGNEAVSISGGQQVTGWQMFDEEKGIYSASFGREVDTRQLYVNDRRATRARSTGGINECKLNDTGMTTSDVEMASWKNQENIEFSFVGAWTLPRCIAQEITIDPNNPNQAVITMAQPCWDNARNKGASSVKNPPRWVENAYELLDESGEWYLDKTGAIGGEPYTFYYKPMADEDMATAEVITPMAEEILHIESDDIDNPVSNLQFEGIMFEHGTYLRPNTMGMVDAQDNNIREAANKGDMATGGNIYLKATQNIVFNSCEFARMGNAAVFMHQGNKDNLIVGSHFYDLSAQAIKIGDVRYSDPKNFYLYEDPEGTANVKMEDWDWRWLQSNNDVVNNVIHDVGQEYYSASAISSGVIEESDFTHNEIFNLPYSGFHLGYGWTAWPEMVSPMGNNRIQYNYIHDCMQEQKDGGAIYTLGVQGCAKGEDGWARKSIISNNYIADQVKLYGSIYLDEGANYYDVYDNVVQNTPEWLLTKHVRNHIHDNYSNQTNMANHASPFEPGSARLENNTFFEGNNLPEGAVKIVNEAGTQDGYGHNHFSCSVAKGKMSVEYDAEKDYPLTAVTSNLINVTNEDQIQLSIQSEGLAGKECKALLNETELTGTGNEEGKVYFGEPIAVKDIPEILGKSGLSVSMKPELPEGKFDIQVVWEKVSGGSREVLISNTISVTVVIKGELKPVFNLDLSTYEVGKKISEQENPLGIITTGETENNKVTVEEVDGEKVIQVTKKDGEVSPGFSIPLEGTGGFVEISADIKGPETSAIAYTLNLNDDVNSLAQIFHRSGKIWHWNHDGGEVYDGTYDVNAWHNVKMVIDPVTRTYDTYVNNELCTEDLQWRPDCTGNLKSLDSGYYRKSAGTYCMKNLKVEATQVPNAEAAELEVAAQVSSVSVQTVANEQTVQTGAIVNEENGFDAARADYISGLKEKGVGDYYINHIRRLSANRGWTEEQYTAASAQSDIMIALVKAVDKEILTDPKAFDIKKFTDVQKQQLQDAFGQVLNSFNLYMADSQLINNDLLNENTEGYEAAVVERRIFDRNTHELLLTVRSDEAAKNFGIIASIENLQAEVTQGAEFALPTEVEARMEDGSRQNVPVVWDGQANTGEIGTFTFEGYAVEYPAKITFTLTVKGEAPQPVNKDALQKLYDENKDKVNENYTEESWKVFQTALQDAHAVLDNPDATQEMVDQAEKALTDAINGLTKEPSEEGNGDSENGGDNGNAGNSGNTGGSGNAGNSGNTGDNKANHTPVTGDNTNLLLLLFIVGASGCVSVYIVLKKMKKR